MPSQDHNKLPTPDLDAPLGGPSWFVRVRGELGEHEITGGENRRIVSYFQACSYHATEDEVAWCSALLCWALEADGIVTPRSAAARDWLTWKGGRVLTSPRHGCIAVIRQKVLAVNDSASGTASGYHVALFSHLQPGPTGFVRLLGGNQGNMVKYSEFPLSRWVIAGYRWPRDR